MKARVATLLSVAGVLVAGSAAALVNTQVLQGGNDALANGGASQESTTIALTPPVVTPTPLPAAATTPTTENTPSDTKKPRRTTTTTDPTAGQKIYQVGESGLVTVELIDGTLTVIDATANPGWTVVSAAAVSPTEILVVFRSGNVEVDFTAATAYGAIGTSVTARELAPPQTNPPQTAPNQTAPTATNPTTAPSYDDDESESEDDESEDDESEDHEDEDEEDESDD